MGFYKTHCDFIKYHLIVVNSEFEVKIAFLCGKPCPGSLIFHKDHLCFGGQAGENAILAPGKLEFR